MVLAAALVVFSLHFIIYLVRVRLSALGTVSDQFHLVPSLVRVFFVSRRVLFICPARLAATKRQMVHGHPKCSTANVTTTGGKVMVEDLLFHPLWVPSVNLDPLR